MNMIKYFEKIIKENKSEMLQITILYNMLCHENYNELTDREKERILNAIYATYLKDENAIDLAKFSDIFMDNYKKILSMLLNCEHNQLRNFIYNNI